MSDIAKPLTEEGWAIPGAANKAHFFREDRRSVCGRWFLPLGTSRTQYDTTINMEAKSAYDCAACIKAVAKIVAKREAEASS